MGYKVGQGLGRHGEGIINPIRASKRNDFDRQGPQHDARSTAAVSAEDEEEREEQRQFQLQLQQWRINEVRRTELRVTRDSLLTACTGLWSVHHVANPLSAFSLLNLKSES